MNIPFLLGLTDDPGFAGDTEFADDKGFVPEKKMKIARRNGPIYVTWWHRLSKTSQFKQQTTQKKHILNKLRKYDLEDIKISLVNFFSVEEGN